MPKKGKKAKSLMKRWTSRSKVNNSHEDLSKEPYFDIANTYEGMQQNYESLSEAEKQIANKSDSELCDLSLNKKSQESAADISEGSSGIDNEINNQTANQLPTYKYSNKTKIESNTERSNQSLYPQNRSEMSPIKRNSLQESVFASFSQSDLRFSSVSRDRQCTCNAMLMLLYVQQKSCFTTNILNEILTKGDELYHGVLYDLIKSGKFQSYLLQFEDLPLTVKLNSCSYIISKKNILLGTIVEMQNLPFSQTLHTAVTIMLQETGMGLIIAGAICSAVFRDDNEKLAFFDSHSHGQNGLSAPKGKALLKYFNNLDDLLAYMYAFYDSLGIEFNYQFEVQPVTVKITDMASSESIDIVQGESAENLSEYLKYQMNMATKSNSSATISGMSMNDKQQKRDYNREYKQKQRMDSTFRYQEKMKEIKTKNIARGNKATRQKERMKEHETKKKAREDDNFRQIEATAKKKIRLNDEYRQKERRKELETKKKAREDEDFRQKERMKELRTKKKAREDEDFRQTEAAAKKNIRLNDDYRQKERRKELETKKKAREDDNFRQIEATAKKKIRLNDEYRQKERRKELETKKKAREDEDFRQKERMKELRTKKKAREDEDFRQTEAAAKRNIRLNHDYRQKERRKELETKKNAREDEDFRQTEAAAKRNIRLNHDYRQKERMKELETKKNAREDEDFRQTEAAAKKNIRLNDDYRQKERMKELETKKKAREDEDFRQNECVTGRRSKQNARHSTYFREKERIAKQSLRQDKEYRNKERMRDADIKQIHRCNKSYHCTEDERCHGIQKAIDQFHKAISVGPIYVCTCCHQTWFRHSVVEASKSQIMSAVKHDFKQCLTSYISKDGKEWICKTCLSSIQNGKIPSLSIANKMAFPDKPSELNLHQLEERLIALRIPFMQLRELPRGGQLSIRGNVVNVPVDIQPTIKALPRQLVETTVPVRLKRKMVYNKCEFIENVRPANVIAALHWLLRNSDMYKTSGIEIDSEWICQMTSNANDIVKSFTDISKDEVYDDNHDDEDDGNQSDTFSEIDDKEIMIGNADTLIVEACPQNDSTYTFAPGEGQQPLSLYSDTDSEYLSFPTIFCGQRRVDNSERDVNVHYSDIAKWELRNVDRRAANSVPNIFYKMKKIQMKQISDKVNLSLRRCKSKDKNVTAAEALNPTQMNKLVNLDEGFYIFRTLRNSPPYLEKRKKDVFAMIRQLGLPTWFASLSAGDTRWHDLLRMLGELNDNKSYTDEEIEQMSWNDKTHLVQKDPITCSRYFDHRVQKFINTILKSDHAPLGVLKDYFYRVEFQNRGSPHIHMLIWIEDAPKYKINTNEEIADYVHKHTSCEVNVDDSVSSLVVIQTHRHSKTCRRKGKPVCRFGFPLPPMSKTMILEPLDDDNPTWKQKYVDIQNRLNDSKELDSLMYDEFLKDVAQMSEEEYIKCIRSSLISPKVFLRRKPSEVRINPYMKTLLHAWKANHDLQFVLDPYACAVYIVAYISKSQRGMSVLLDEACKEARKGNMDIKRQVRHMGNKFLNSVEVSAQEACYLVLQMPLTKASREVVFINTSAATERTFLLKQKDVLEGLPPDSTDIEADNVIKRYSKRPKQLSNMCLADYVSELDIKYPKKKQQCEEINDDDPIISESEDEDEETDLSGNWNKITLKNGIVIKRRKLQRVIRYVRYNIKTDSENHLREKLLLFLPWRNEETDLLGGFNTYEDHYSHVKPSVCAKITHYEHHSNELDLALQQAESELSEQFDNIAPMTQHTEEEDYDEGSHESEQFVYYKPVSGQHKDYDIGTDLGMSRSIPHVESTSTLLPNDEYLQLVGKLNVKQREFFIHVLHWIKSNDEPLYAFLTGGAGVGKSLVITVLYQALHRYLCSFEGENPDDCKILLCAPTGKAAYNIGGTTIHAAFKIRPNQGYSTYTVDSDTLNTLRVKYKNLSVVIIDEVSMVGNKMLLLVNECLQRIKGNQNKLFGGVSVILIGDLYQLKPVMDKWIFEDLNEQMGPLATNLWKSLFTMHELTEIMRQKDDKDFAELLNRLRSLENDKLSDADLKCLESRVVKPDDANYPLTAPHLYTTNAQVDSFNHKLFNNTEMEKVTIPSLDTVVGDLQAAVKERLLKALPQTVSNTAGLPNRLLVAVDMAYDITANLDILDGLVNGASCYVKLIDYRQQQTSRPSILWVQFDDDSIGKERRRTYKHLRKENMSETWTPIFDTQRTFLYNRKSFIRIQFPLRPAAAKTIHKSQGSTMNVVAVDMSSKRKQPHMHYVAFSRVRNLVNLHILNLNAAKISVDLSVKIEMERLKNEAKLQLSYKPPYTISADKLKVAFLNTRSLPLHYNDIKNDPNIISTDVMAFAETKLRNTNCDEHFILDGFQLQRNDELNSPNPHHGLAIYCKNDIVILHVDSFSSFEFEYMFTSLKKGVDFYPSPRSCVHIVASPGAGKISQPLQKRRQHWLPSFHPTVIQEYSGYRAETQTSSSEIRAPPVSLSRDTPASKSPILYIPRGKPEAESTSLLSPVTGQERVECIEEAHDHTSSVPGVSPSDLPVSDKHCNLPPAGATENTGITGYQENNLAELSFHSETRPNINQALPTDSNNVVVMIKSVPRQQPGPLSTGSTATGATMNSPSEPPSIQIGLEDERGESKAVEIDTGEQEDAAKLAEDDDLDETAKGKKRSVAEIVERTRESGEAMIASMKENAELRQKEFEQLLNEHAEIVQEIGRASSSENINIEQKG